MLNVCKVSDLKNFKLGLRRLFLYVGQGFSLATVCTRNRATLKGRPTTALKFLYVKLGLRRLSFAQPRRVRYQFAFL
jgi:hypothetical protein